MLGADVNSEVGAVLPFNLRNSKQTILDAVRGVITQAGMDLGQMEKARIQSQNNDEKIRFQLLAKIDGWKGTLGKRVLSIMEDDVYENTAASTSSHLLLGGVRDSTDAEDHLRRSIEYFIQLEKDLVSRGAKTWKELHPDEEPFTIDLCPTGFYGYYGDMKPRVPGFTKMSGSGSTVGVPRYQTALYEELFEACCTGDNAKIEELCLPKTDGQEGIQITARFGGRWGKCPRLNYDFHVHSLCMMTGVSPLTLALENRRWSTARLVLTLAIAQYKDQDTTGPRFTATRGQLGELFVFAHDRISYLCIADFELDVGSDADVAMDEEMYFVDVAHTPSQVQVNVPPERLLSTTHRYQDPETKSHIDGWPLQGAIIQHDFEAFVQIAELYKLFPKPLDLPPAALTWTIRYDRPTMLDEIIRRTGVGIYVPGMSQGEDELAEGAHSTFKAYLGLNVHGKKRENVAQTVAPNVPIASEKHEFPLAWTAAHDGALECVRYLASERALAAYRYYASTHSDDRARYLRRIDGQLSQRLGWCVNELNESIITAAVIGDQVKLLKAVIELRPEQLQDSLMARLVSHSSLCVQF